MFLGILGVFDLFVVFDFLFFGVILLLIIKELKNLNIFID